MQPTNNQSPTGQFTGPNTAAFGVQGAPAYVQPGVSTIPQHVPAFDAPLAATAPVPGQPSSTIPGAQPTFDPGTLGQPLYTAPSGTPGVPVVPGAVASPTLPTADGLIPNQPQVVAGGQTQPAVQPAQKANPNSTQNTLQIAEIRDGIIIMNDGSYRSIVMVKSINFDLMSQQEQEAVEYSYQGFLNSLYFPIQIFIRSQKVDLQPYIDKLDKIRTEHDNMLLALLMDDYINYIDQLGQQTNIMDKKFYVVIPFFPHVDVQKAFTQSKNFLTGFVGLFNNKQQHVVVNEEDLEKAKTELRNRVQAVLSGLVQCNIQGLPLDTQELIELMYDTYNPDTATRQQLKNFSGNLDADIITKGSGQAVQPHMQSELM